MPIDAHITLGACASLMAVLFLGALAIDVYRALHHCSECHQQSPTTRKYPDYPRRMCAFCYFSLRFHQFDVTIWPARKPR